MAGASVPGDGAGAPAVVQAHERDVDVLADAIAGAECAGGRDGVDGKIAHEQVIVFEANRKDLRKSALEAGAVRGSPAGFIDRAGQSAGSREGPVPVSDNRSAALHVAEHVVPGPADLASQQSERVDTRLVSQA